MFCKVVSPLCCKIIVFRGFQLFLINTLFDRQACLVEASKLREDKALANIPVSLVCTIVLSSGESQSVSSSPPMHATSTISSIVCLSELFLATYVDVAWSQ